MKKTPLAARLANEAWKAGFDPYPSAYAAAWLMIKARKSNTIDLTIIPDLLKLAGAETDSSKMLVSLLTPTWGKYLKVLDDATTEELIEFLMSDDLDAQRRSCITPESVLNLVFRLLQSPDGSTFADLGSGTGNVLLYAASHTRARKIVGLEILKDANLIARFRTDVADETQRVAPMSQDGFDARTETDEFDRVFCHPPFGLRMSPKSMNALNKRIPSLSEIGTNVSSDWLFAIRASNLLGFGGRGVVLLSNGAVSSKADLRLRKYLIDRNLVQAVIELPGGLLDYTAIPIDLVLLGKGRPCDETDILFVDASKLGRKIGRKTTLSEEDVTAIASCVNKAQMPNGSQILPHRWMPRHDVEQDSFILTPRRYTDLVHAEDSDVVPLGMLVESINRGVSLAAGELDRIKSSIQTENRYITQANIQDGIIDDALPYLKEIPVSNKYCAKAGDLLLTKLGRPMRVACVSEQHDRGNLLVSSNLYIISVKKDLVDPLWLKAYLESESGQRAIESISVGATIPTVTIPDLMKIRIPMSCSDVRNELVTLYKERQTRVAELSKALELAREELFSAYDDVMHITK